MTSKDIAFLIDSGSFLQYIQVESSLLRSWLLHPFSLSGSTNFSKLLGGLKPPQPPASDGPGYHKSEIVFIDDKSVTRNLEMLEN